MSRYEGIFPNKNFIIQIYRVDWRSFFAIPPFFSALSAPYRQTGGRTPTCARICWNKPKYNPESGPHFHDLEVLSVCLENHLRLLPLIILFAALLAGLTIAFASAPAALFPYALAVATAVLVTTAIIAGVCGLRRATENICRSACAAVHCLAPITIGTAILAIGLALVAIAGFSVSPTVNIILGSLYALLFSAMLVYFGDMFLGML